MNKKDLLELGLTKEALEKAGLAEDLLDKIIILHGKDIEKHKTDLATAQTSIDELKGQLKTAGETIEGFKKMDVEGIKKAADEYKQQAATAIAEADKKVAQMQFDIKLDRALDKAGAKNLKAIRALLTLEDLKLAKDGETITGLKEQLDAVREENEFMFNDSEGSGGEGEESDTEPETKPTPKIITGTKKHSAGVSAIMVAMRKGAQLPPTPPDKQG